MRERRQIVDLWHRGHSAALATLVCVEGSSYRRPGARLLIASNGEYAGAISGGCLEAEVIRKAQWLVRNGAVVERYSTLFDDTADIPYGLGCGGTVDVLLEPANTPEFTALMQALEASLKGDSFQIESHLPTLTKPLHRTLQTHSSELTAHSSHHTVQTHSSELKAHSSHHTRFPSISPQIFTEFITPPQRLIVIGAGDDAQPLVQMASLLGWRIAVIDGRPQWAHPSRFPQAEQVLSINPLDGSQSYEPPKNTSEDHGSVGMGFSPYNQPSQFEGLQPLRANPAAGVHDLGGARLVTQDFSPGPACHNPVPKNGALAPGLQIDDRDAVVLMTHSYEQDRAWRAQLRPLRPRYLGLLGARHRSALLVSEAAAILRWPVEKACAELFAPVGLDLGGDGAESVALAVIAEIQARIQGKIGLSRRMTPEMVAEQLTLGGSSRYLQTHCAL